jgi:hypothetical protein
MNCRERYPAPRFRSMSGLSGADMRQRAAARSSSSYPVGQVFRIDSMPGVFQVERKEDGKLREIRFELEHSAHIIHIYGGSKSGKTHFTRAALGNRNSHLLSCREASTPEDLWKILAADLNIPVRTRMARSAGDGGAAKASLDFRVSMQSSAQLGAASEEIDESVYRQCAKEISKQDSALIIDDFQLLSPDDQSQVIRQLRPFLDGSVRVVLNSVYEGAGRDDVVENAEGRIKRFAFPRWAPGDIEQIAIGGFELLNCRLDAAVVQAMRKLSNRNPLLMTELCLEICKRKKISHTMPKLELLRVTASDLEAAIRSIAESQSWLLTRFLQTGEEKSYQLRDTNRMVNLRTLLLLALKDHDPGLGIGLDALRTRMERLLAKGFALPVKSVLQRQVKRYIKKSQDAPRSSWFLDCSTDTKLVDLKVVDVMRIHIVNPYFRTVVEWYLAPMAGFKKSIEI